MRYNEHGQGSRPSYPELGKVENRSRGSLTAPFSVFGSVPMLYGVNMRVYKRRTCLLVWPQAQRCRRREREREREKVGQTAATHAFTSILLSDATEGKQRRSPTPTSTQSTCAGDLARPGYMRPPPPLSLPAKLPSHCQVTPDAHFPALALCQTVQTVQTVLFFTSMRCVKAGLRRESWRQG